MVIDTFILGERIHDLLGFSPQSFEDQKLKYQRVDNSSSLRVKLLRHAEGGRMMLCYVQGSGKRKRQKGVGCGGLRQENYGSERRDCGRIRIWDPGIKIYFRHHFEDKVVVKEWGTIRPRKLKPKSEIVTAWVAEGGRMVLCYVQGSERRKRQKGVGCGSERQENYESERRLRDGNKTSIRRGPDSQTRIDWRVLELTGDENGDGESSNYETGDETRTGIT
uniref:Uncharacterized protein n=1 Tax=Tanacetum cinerariifolium TaxID=118510 RepID=A0A699HGR9_TANCI|nr:hypothetical protein [Tanacetum cinerariifolium]